MCKNLSSIHSQDLKYQQKLQDIEDKLKDLKMQKQQKNKMIHKIQQMTQIRDKLEADIAQIKLKPDYMAEKGFQNVKALKK